MTQRPTPERGPSGGGEGGPGGRTPRTPRRGMGCPTPRLGPPAGEAGWHWVPEVCFYVARIDVKLAYTTLAGKLKLLAKQDKTSGQPTETPWLLASPYEKSNIMPHSKPNLQMKNSNRTNELRAKKITQNE